jgi:hypothetical protein
MKTFLLNIAYIIATLFFPISGQKISAQQSLQNVYLTYPDDVEHLEFDHWFQYSPSYEANIHQLRKQSSIRMLEMGVHNGGSISVWKQYFANNNLTYIGLDREPQCKKLHDPTNGIMMTIGSPKDTAVINSICDQYGPFDLIIDDGENRTTEMMMISFRALWPRCMKDHAVYVIVDTYTMTLSQNQATKSHLYEDKDIYQHMTDLMNDRSSYFYYRKNGFLEYNEPPKNERARYLQAMNMYDSMIFLHFRKEWKPLNRITRGQVKTVG